MDEDDEIPRCEGCGEKGAPWQDDAGVKLCFLCYRELLDEAKRKADKVRRRTFPKPRKLQKPRKG